jgi:hypothetical protein
MARRRGGGRNGGRNGRGNESEVGGNGERDAMAERHQRDQRTTPVRISASWLKWIVMLHLAVLGAFVYVGTHTNYTPAGAVG